MKRKTAIQSAFLTPRVLVGLTFCAIILSVPIAFTLHSGGNVFAAPKQQDQPEVSAVAQESAFLSDVTQPEASTPTLGDYGDTSVSLSGNTTITPSAAPANTTNIAVSTDTNFNGIFVASPTTGAVRVTDAHPVGIYTVTVTAFGPGGTTAKTFLLTVPSNPCGGISDFTSAASVSPGSDPRSLAIGDFNGDGKQDFAVTNASFGSGTTVSIRLGNGVGGFSSGANVSVGTLPIAVAIGDFNGDGKQDLAVANNSSNTVSIRLGNGSGGFSGSTEVSVGSHPYSVAIGDFNGDGKQDLAVASYNTNAVSIRLGDGLGGFSGSTEVSVGSRPFWVAVGDFNGDGKQDFATANSNSSSVSIRLGDGLGGFNGSTEVSVGSSPFSLAIGDFNGDGKQDLAAASNGQDKVSIRLGDGLGGFSGSTEVSVGSGADGVAIGDFNGDGNQDLAVATFSAHGVSIRFGDGMGGFSGSMEVGAGGGPQKVAVGDFNGDGRQDLAILDSPVSILLGLCYFPTPSPSPTPSPTPCPLCTPTPSPTPSPVPSPTPFFCTLIYQNFDYTTPPNLAPEWSSSFTAGAADCTPNGTCPFGSNWVTTNNNPYSGPTCVFHDAPACVTDSVLVTPSFSLPSSCPIAASFEHSFNLESGHDGAVLEISINGGPFVDIVSAGGSVNYNGTISTGTLSPIAGRQAWTGNSGGYVSAGITFPFAARGQQVALRFRLATDCAGGGNGMGWFIDVVYIFWNCESCTPAPSPTPVVSISGNVSYCSNPTPVPVPSVVMSLTGSSSRSTLSSNSGNYAFLSLAAGGNYTVTPSKAALSPPTDGINTVDIVAVQRQFLGFGILSGCQLSAANVNGDANVNTQDVIAVQRFYLGFTNGTANVGKYQFNPSSRSYPNLTGNQTNQNYDALIFGDVASPFIYNTPAIPVLEAENAVLTGCYAQSDVQASNGFRVDGIDAVGDSVKFTQVPVGTHVMFWYATPNNGQMSLYVNDVFRAQVDFAATPGGWVYPFVGKEVVTDIPVGSSVKLQFDSGDVAINLDYIQIY